MIFVQGVFLQTYAYQGDLYGLSLQAVEAVASESLACVTQMELEVGQPIHTSSTKIPCFNTASHIKNINTQSTR